MLELLEILQEEWAIRALIASSLVGIMCGTIGVFIVLRNMSLIGDALSHAILPGIVVAFMLVGYSTIGFFVGSVGAGLLCAFIITWIQHNVKTKNDASIGIVFTAMFSVGVIGISSLNRSEGVHLDLKDFLFGSVMGISNEDIILSTIVCLYTLISIVLFYRYLFITTFQPTIAATMGISVKMIHYFLMLLLSFAVVSSLRTVGVILVVAMLITPAATALLITDKLKRVLIYSGLIGLASAIIGLIGAILLDMPPGPAMCITATLIYLLAGVFAPKNGLLTRYINTRKQRSKITVDHILRSLSKSKDKQLSLDSIVQKLNVGKSKIKTSLSRLLQDGWITKQSDYYSLTPVGKIEAERLERAHRLWETYLVNQVGLEDGQIHNEADQLEHFLTDELLDEVDKKLGYPETDPHGSPIPRKVITPKSPLSRLGSNTKGKIAKEQVNEKIENALWELGLAAESEFILSKSSGKNIDLKLSSGKVVSIDTALADLINVNRH